MNGGLQYILVKVHKLRWEKLERIRHIFMFLRDMRWIDVKIENYDIRVVDNWMLLQEMSEMH